MRASHVEKRDYLRHGIENAARASLSDARLPRFWSGFRFDIVPFRLFPLRLSLSHSHSHSLSLSLSLSFLVRLSPQSSATRSSKADPTSSPRRSRRYRGVGAGGAVNQRQGRVVGRGIGAARCFWNDVVQRLRTLIAERSGFTGAMQIEPQP